MGLTATVLLALFLVDGQLEASSGGPPNCDDGHVCTDDSCHPTTGCVHTSNTAPCSDGNACAVGDVWSGGRCVRGATSRSHEGCGPWRGGLPLWRSWRRTQDRWGAASNAQLCGPPSCGSRSTLCVVCSGRPPVALKVECYGATRPPDGGSANEDAFVIGRGPIKFAAPGKAERVARRLPVRPAERVRALKPLPRLG